MSERHAEHFAHAIGVHGDGDYYRDRDDPPGLPYFHVGGIDPQIRPVPFDRAVQERLHALVDLAAQARDLALADAAHAHGLDQFIHRAGRHALDVGLLDHGRQGLLAGAPRLQEPGEIAAFAELGDLQIHAPSPGLPQPFAVAIAAVGPLGAALPVGGGADALRAPTGRGKLRLRASFCRLTVALCVL